MDDISKLAHLVGHWMEHNDEHASNYRGWAEKARSAGKNEAADLLERIAGDTERMNDLFREIKEALEN